MQMAERRLVDPHRNHVMIASKSRARNFFLQLRTDGDRVLRSVLSGRYATRSELPGEDDYNDEDGE